MAKFFHVGFGFAGKHVGIEKIQAAFGTAGWARYAPNCWIIYTEESPNSLVDRLHNLCTPQDSVFICELNISNKWGYLQKEIWDWIRQKLLENNAGTVIEHDTQDD